MKRTLGLGMMMISLAACSMSDAVGEGMCLLGGACGGEVEEGGANANDRTNGGEAGEQLLTGVMEIAPSGKYALMQRNTVTILLDVEAQTQIELPTQLSRVALSKVRDVAYALYADGTLAALDLGAAAMELWRVKIVQFTSPSLLRVSDDDSALVLVDGQVVYAIDAATGAARGSSALPTGASYGAFLPKAGKAILVGQTTFQEHKPSTPVMLVNLTDASVSQIDVPNCEAPISVLPDESRALLSPTFCEEDRASTPDDTWTNPDPVSIIDVGAEGLTFVKNLPGFGPVALSPDGERAVAYLDVARIDPTMFDDKSKIPGAGAPEYHLMTIDPKSLAYDVYPIGNALPRFAMSRDGKGLLVDASVKMAQRVTASAKASATVSINPDGVTAEAEASLTVFGAKAPFGYFEIATGRFTGFGGQQAGLDRFVQLADGKTVITLEKRKDGLGGVPYRIDIWAKATTPLFGDYGTGVRDIGLLPDGVTMLLRFRQPAAQIGTQLYSRESYCYSLDAVTCGVARVEYQASVAFASVESNDCPSMGHDCW